MMAKLADEGSREISVRSKAIELTRGLKQKDFAGEAKACLEFCRDDIRYVRDILHVETLHTPEWVLKIGAGDCDDKSILLGAMLASIGHPVRFIAAAFFPGQYSHVWTQDLIYGKWVDLEPTEPIPFGARIPAHRVVSEITENV